MLVFKMVENAVPVIYSENMAEKVKKNAIENVETVSDVELDGETVSTS
jgi:hypothetical protein